MTPIKKSFTTLCFCFLLLQIGCSSGEPLSGDQPEAPSPLSVQVMTAEMISLNKTLELAGTVRPRRRVVITSKLPGTLSRVEAMMGERVRAGQILMTIDDRGPSLELAQAQAGGEVARRGREQAENAVVAAEADAHLAATTLQRIQQLFDKRSASQQELDQAKARQQAAQAGVEMARGRVEEARAHELAAAAAIAGAQLRLSYTKIESPLDGYVVSRHVDPGVVVAPGMPLLEIEEAQEYRLEIAVPESQSGNLRIGLPIQVQVDSIGLRASGRLVEIEPAAEPGSRTSLARVQLPAHPGLHSGLYGKAMLPAGKQDTLLIPEETILRQGQISYVYVLQEGTAQRRLISLGKKHEQGLEVLAGLRSGEQVITGELGRLADGSPVEIAR